jgi:hypothetical protein
MQRQQKDYLKREEKERKNSERKRLTKTTPTPAAWQREQS